MAESDHIAPFFQVPENAPESDREYGDLSVFYTECENSVMGLHNFFEENRNTMILQGQMGIDDWFILSVLKFERSEQGPVSVYTERLIRDEIDNSIEWRLNLGPDVELDSFWRSPPVMYITGSNFDPEVKGIEITVLTPLDARITSFEDVKKWAGEFFPRGVVTPL